MRKVLVLAGVAVVGACALMGCASSGSAPAATAAMTDAELHRGGRVIFAGQVTPAQFRELRAQGVGTVVNCRTQPEMDGLPFDQAALLAELGMAYVQVPLGRDMGYSPEDVDEFARVMRAHGGDVLVHCGSGGRARLLYTAYLVRHEGLSVDEARRRVELLGEEPSPLELLLGERLRYELTGEALPASDEDAGGS